MGVGEGPVGRVGVVGNFGVGVPVDLPADVGEGLPGAEGVGDDDFASGVGDGVAPPGSGLGV